MEARRIAAIASGKSIALGCVIAPRCYNTRRYEIHHVCCHTSVVIERSSGSSTTAAECHSLTPLNLPPRCRDRTVFPAAFASTLSEIDRVTRSTRRERACHFHPSRYVRRVYRPCVTYAGI